MGAPMPKAHSATNEVRTIAQIRQFCCLGLGSQASAPALTRLLLRLIPGLSVTFFFTDANGELVDFYDENPATPQVAPLYVSEFYQRRESDVVISITDVFRRGMVGMNLGHLLKVDQRTWERSDLYNLILRPVDYFDGLQVAVRDRERPLGVVKISRDPGAPEFTRRDLNVLVALESHLAHAFMSPANMAPLVDSDAEENQGLIITDRSGCIRYLSPQARVLLFYATYPRIAPGKLRSQVNLALPPAVARLARLLAQTFDGKPPAVPPVHHHENAWGRFAFRAYWLDGLGTEPPLVGIQVSRQEPLALRLLRRMEHLPLSERQVAVSLQLASGLTYAAIAERLGLSRSTVIFHAQEAFNKLGVASRAELQAKLMAL